MSASLLLDVKGVSKYFGGLRANEDVSFQVNQGEIISIIGPNGAGKSTLFSCITGFHRLDKGRVLFKGQDITNRKPHVISKLGIVRTFQIVQVISDMTVLENVMTGAFLRHTSVHEVRRKAEEVLSFTGLIEKKNYNALEVTISDKKRLEVSMALAMEPELLMLDESMAGLTPVELREMIRLIRKVRENGLTVVVVEHVMEAVMELSDRVIVLNSGSKIAEGSPKEVVANPEVIRAYLGEGTMLSVNNISVGYKGLLAIQDVSFEVKKGEVVSLIGSNGAGKTTLLKTILGLLKPIKGEIRLNDQVISGRKPYDVVKMKIALVPEGRRLFPRLSVQDNLTMGAYTVDSNEQIAETMESVLRLFPWLKERADQRAGTLSGGEQQHVAIARGLMSRPDLLMLDEPSLGVMPLMVTEIFRTVERITSEGVTVLLVEQNVFQALKVCHRAYVLQTGRIVMEGTGSELSQSDLVRKAFLGM